ncbi:LOG family protein [candidate division WWE3 bacterium]|nr:LOG family protein [candidate division WWE3 bacterium]
MKITNISILGGAEWQESDTTYLECKSTCELLAKSGYTILNGGGPGVMKAATEGAHLAQGKVIGVTFYPKGVHKHFEGRDKTNLIDEEIEANDYFDRTKKLLQLGQCHIVFKGGTGTISEFGMSWASSRIHQGHQIPLILFGHFWHDIVKSLNEYMYMRIDEFKLYKIVKTPTEVLGFIKSLEQLDTLEQVNLGKLGI